MKHATSLVCIIWLLIFFNACSQGYSPLPGKERQENDSKNHAASPTLESYPDDQTQSEDSPGKAEEDSTHSNDAQLGGQSEESALSRAKWPLETRIILARIKQDEMVGSDRRAQIGNQANADILISLHCDGTEDPQIYGLSILYPGDKYIKDQKMLEKSLALSKAILGNTVSAANAKDRGLSQRNNLIVFNYTDITGYRNQRFRTPKGNGYRVSETRGGGHLILVIARFLSHSLKWVF